jgi:hypothetical protein
MSGAHILLRLRQIGALLSFAAVVSGCYRTPPPTGEAVIAFTLDPHGTYVTAFAVGLPSKLVRTTPSIYYLKTNHGITTEWKKKSVMTQSGSATITFVPLRREKGPGITDDVAAYYFRRTDGHLDVLPLTYVQPPVPSPAPILNPDFQYWTSEVYPSPVSWPITAAPGASFDVRVLGKYEGVRLSVATSPLQSPGAIATPVPGGAPAVRLTQAVQLRGRHLRARMRPFEPCAVVNGRVIVAAGVELSAASATPSLFCVGRNAFSGPANLGGSPVAVTIVPGTIGAWNDVDFNIATAKRALGNAPVTLAIITQVDATRSPYDWITLDVASVASAP